MTSARTLPVRRISSLLQLSFGVTAASVLPLLSLPAWAATKPNAAAEVKKTLAAEERGGAVARDEQLAKVIASEPAYAPARWAAGYVEQEGKWLKFDAAANGGDEKQAEYRQMRDDAPDTAAGQLKLANWCRQHGLKDHERAHLLRVLDFEPNRTDVRERLGMKHVGGVWMTSREAQRAALRGKQAVADLKHWLPRVEKFRTALDGPAGRIHDLAAEHVRETRDPTAMVAFETVLAPSSDEAGAAVVDALTAMKRPDAAIALARIATFSESAVTSDAARAKLKTLPLDHFVPAMLASLVVAETGPTTVASDYYWGRLLFQQAFTYETADRKQKLVFDNLYSTYTIRGFSLAQKSEARLVESAVGSAVAAGRAMVADAQNRKLQRTNARIIETLREVTGQTLSADPHDWWQWWNEINEIVPVGEKPTDVTFVEEKTSLLTAARPHCACLIAGTPIWTDRGPIAVEKMHVGDRVLAQDAASGELAYKPVLQTTVRPKAPLIHITLADETIVASGGHPFWIAGKGWVNARHLVPGMLIHTVTGTAPVEKVEVEEDGRQPVYNLVVEDFHDYFAGNSHVLLHDITPREPTLGTVPGWQE